MNQFTALFHRLRFFLTPLLVVWVAVLALLYVHSKIDLHLAVNRYSTAWADTVFQIFTWIGDGITMTIFLVLFLFVHKRTALVTGISAILASLITFLLKTTVYYGEPRPVLFFNMQHVALREVPGLTNNLYNTFPSGHTTLMFAVCCGLAWYYRKNWMQWGLLLVAILVGFSRIYLSQHFLNDVLAGSVVGTFTCMLVIFLVDKKFPETKQS